MKTCIVSTMVALVAAACCSTGRANLIVNGDFSADEAAITAANGGDGNWGFYGLTADPLNVYPDPIGTPIGWADGGINPGSDATQDFFEFLDGEHNGHSNPIPPSGQGNTILDVNNRYLLQTVGGLIPGEAYELSFFFANVRSGANNINTGLAEVYDNADATGLVDDFLSPELNNGEFGQYSIKFVAPDTDVTVRFSTGSIGGGSSNTNFGTGVDNVSLMRIPEPSTMLLGGLGLLAVAVWRRQ